MAKHDPYYVRRGWVDEDGHIRCIESSLKIMNNVDDVYGEEAIDENDSVAGVNPYPAPRDDAGDNPYTAGYYYLGEMIELIDSMPSSPVEEATPSPLTSDDDVESNPLATVTSIEPNPRFQLASLPTANAYSSGQINNIYSQTLPYANAHDRLAPQSRSIAPRHGVSARDDLTSTYANFATGPLMASLSTATSHVTASPVMPPTSYVPPIPIMTSLPATGFHNAAPHITPHTGFAPPTANMTSLPGFHSAAPPVMPHTNFAPIAPNLTYPYRPITAPTSSSGSAILTLPNGSRVGQPVPPELHPVIDAIRNLKVIGNTEHPERKILKKPYEGTYQTASKDRQLIRDHFASGSGLLKMDSPLRDWYGDLRVFSAKMWEFLAVQKTRLNVGVKG
jgi:hypothetical protein